MIKQILLRDFMRKELERYKRLYAEMSYRLRYLPEGTIAMRRGEECRTGRLNGKKYLFRDKSDHYI